MTEDDAIVGIFEVAVALGVERDTVVQWIYRGVAPARDLTVDGKAAWRWGTIRRWARDTSRG